MSPYILNKHGKPLFTVFILLFALSTLSHAGIMQYDNYRQGNDIVKEREQKAFIICSSCPSVKRLSSISAIFPLSIKAEVVNPSPFVLKTETSRTENPSLRNKTVQTSPAPLVATRDKTVVYFDFDSTVLKDPEKNKLDQSVPSGGRVDTVTGYTCDIGTKEYNDRLALERAESVSSYLKEKGVIPLKIEGKGKCCYISQERKLNRRVEITAPSDRNTNRKGGVE